MNEEAGLKKPPKRFSKRGFLRLGATAAGAALLVPVLYPLASYLGEEQHDSDPYIQESKKYLKETYGIDVSTEPEKAHAIEGQRASVEQCRATLRVLREELLNYPPEMLRAVGEGRGFKLEILDHPTMEMEQEGSPEKKRVPIGSGMSQEEDGPWRMYSAASEPEADQRRAVHHELNHLFAKKWQNWKERWARWVGFHSEVTDHPYHPEPKGTHADDKAREPYFLEMHASSNAEDDQAICAEWMMIPLLHYKFVERWRNEQDPKVKKILGWKYPETVKNYKEWGGEHFSNQFWLDKYEEGKRQHEKPK
jgi:hypothetical protein